MSIESDFLVIVPTHIYLEIFTNSLKTITRELVLLSDVVNLFKI